MIKLPKRFEQATILDWEEDTPIHEILVKYLSNFGEYLEQGAAPLFLGTSGVGKSRAAAALLHTIQERASTPLTCMWFGASDVFNAVLDAKDMRLTTTHIKLVQALKASDIIVLDDISTLRDSPRLLEYFWIILDHRYNELLPTIITANFDTDISPDRIWDVLSNWYTPAISRRLKELSTGLTVLL